MAGINFILYMEKEENKVKVKVSYGIQKDIKILYV